MQNSAFTEPTEPPSPFARRVWTATLIVASVFGAILLLWLAAKVFLLFLAGTLLAIFLRSIADFIGRLLHLSRGWSLASAIVLLFCVFGAAGWLLATPVSNEVQHISDELPQALDRLQTELRQYPFGRTVLERLHDQNGLFAQAGALLKRARTVFSISIEGIIDIWVILFCGFYLAARPELYRDGFLRLMPPQRRLRGREVLGEMGTELQHWLLGQIVSMAIIGFLTWLGLFLLGVPGSQLLGILAGLLDFIPVAGPWVAGVISCLLALLRSPMHAVYVACLFVALHLLEGHLLIPLVQRQATRMPPVLTILAMVLFYTLFGFLGLLLAVPLLVLVLIGTRSLYVEPVIEQ